MNVIDKLREFYKQVYLTEIDRFRETYNGVNLINEKELEKIYQLHKITIENVQLRCDEPIAKLSIKEINELTNLTLETIEKMRYTAFKTKAKELLCKIPVEKSFLESMLLMKNIREDDIQKIKSFYMKFRLETKIFFENDTISLSSLIYLLKIVIDSLSEIETIKADIIKKGLI